MNIPSLLSKLPTLGPTPFMYITFVSDGFFSVLFVLCAVRSVMGKTGECFPAAAAGELFGSDAAIGGKQ